MSSLNNGQFSVSWNSNGSITLVLEFFGDNTLVTTPTNISPIAGGWHYIEFLITLSSTGSSTDGVFVVQADGQQVLSVSNLQLKYNYGASNFIDTLSVTTGGFLMDDLYIINGAGSLNATLLGNQKVYFALPTTNGSTNNFTSSTSNPNWQNVDDNPGSMTTYNYDGTVNDVDLYTIGSVGSTGLANSASVNAVQVVTLAEKDAVGNCGMASVIKSAVTQDTKGDHAMSTTPQYYFDVWETDPNTSAAWTPSGAATVQIGAEVLAS